MCVKLLFEIVAIDTIYSYTPATDNSSTCIQVFVGTKNILTDVCGVKPGKKIFNALEVNIRKRGAIDKLISDSDQSDVSDRVKCMLRALFMDNFKYEPCY